MLLKSHLLKKFLEELLDKSQSFSNISRKIPGETREILIIYLYELVHKCLKNFLKKLSYQSLREFPEEFPKKNQVEFLKKLVDEIQDKPSENFLEKLLKKAQKIFLEKFSKKHKQQCILKRYLKESLE